MTDHLQPAPEGFEFDRALLEATCVEAFQDCDPDMLREIHAGRVGWRAELGEDRVVRVLMVDKSTENTLGVLKLDWHLVGHDFDAELRALLHEDR